MYYSLNRLLQNQIDYRKHLIKKLFQASEQALSCRHIYRANFYSTVTTTLTMIFSLTLF